MGNKRECIICGSSNFLARTEDKCLSCLTSKRRKGDYLVGIDPDREESGVAIYEIKRKCFKSISTFSFFQLYQTLSAIKDQIALIRIEGGWLNKKANYHTHPRQSKTAGERIAKDVGANHETGKKICEMCEFLQIPYEVVKPLGTKNIDSRLFKKMTGYDKQTNPDKRDAAMLVWNYK